MFDASASCLPLGEIAASARPLNGLLMSDTNLPWFQSDSFAEKGSLPAFSVQRTMPRRPSSIGALAANAMMALPSGAQWIARATLNFGSVLHETSVVPPWIWARHRSVSVPVLGIERIAITFLPVVGAHARSA